MGRNNRVSNFLKLHPYCCFCGGDTPATTIDHVPSRQIFFGKDRPKGLEAPACNKCNNGSSQYEQVAAMLSRIYPNAPNPKHSGEIRDIMKAVNNNFPNLLEEMLPKEEQIELFKRKGTLLNKEKYMLSLSSPIIKKSLNILSYKIGCVLHYHALGKIIPSDGGIAVKYFSNYDKETGYFPSDILNLLGQPQTLQQGKKNVSEQFEYSYVISESSETAVYFAAFRASFATLCWVYNDISLFPEEIMDEVIQPSTYSSLLSQNKATT